MAWPVYEHMPPLPRIDLLLIDDTTLLDAGFLGFANERVCPGRWSPRVLVTDPELVRARHGATGHRTLESWSFAGRRDHRHARLSVGR